MGLAVKTAKPPVGEKPPADASSQGEGVSVGTAPESTQPPVAPTPESQATTPVQAAGVTVPAAQTDGKLPHAVGNVSAGFQVEDPEETTPLLGTALIPILDNTGEIQYGRALLDSGSQLNFITDRFAKKLGLPRLDTKCTVHTIGAVLPSSTVGSVRFQIQYPQGDQTPVLAHVLTKVTGVLPSQRIQVPADFSPQWSDLADDRFNKPGEIDLLVGVEVYEALMMDGKRSNRNSIESRVGDNGHSCTSRR